MPCAESLISLMDVPNPLERDLAEAIDTLDFGTARALVHQAEGSARDRLREHVEDQHREALTRAEHLAARIQSMARADHYEGLLDLGEDPETELLLALLPPELNRGASLHLQGARKRRERFRAAAERRMRATSEALATFDPHKALSEISKVEERWLTRSQRERVADLRAQANGAVDELMEMEERTAEVLRTHDLGNPAPTTRVRRGPGCGGSLLVIIAGLSSLLFHLLG